MNDLKIFSSSEFGELGVMLIDGKEYFPAKQCARILGYKDTTNAIKLHCKGVVKHHLPTAGGMQEANYIPEGDLYRLIVSSKLPAAEKFERWVFDEVLPELRRSGKLVTAAAATAGAGTDIDLEKIITATATAVASEIMRQMLPVIAQSNTALPVIWEDTPPKSRKRKNPYGIIRKLAPELRCTVDEMLRANMPYKDVQAFLNLNGIGISQAAICNYYNSAIADKEEV